MKSPDRLKGSFTALTLLLVLSANAWAFHPPSRSQLPNFDRRGTNALIQAPGEKRSAIIALRTRLPGARVDFEEHTGAPKWVVAERGFLSGMNAQGRGISAEAARAFASEQEHRATKAFIQEHKALFSHGPEALTDARLKHDFVTAHSGLRTVVWEQELDGVPVFQGLLISHTTTNGELVSLSSHFVPNPAQAAGLAEAERAARLKAPAITAVQAVALAGQNLEESLAETNLASVAAQSEGAAQRQRFTAPSLNGEAEAKLVWLPMSQQSLRLCWEVVLTSRARGEMFRLLIDAQTGEALIRHCLTEYLSNATYRVYTSDSPSPFSPGHPAPSAGQPPVVGRSLVTLSALDTNASPAGWINDGGNETWGNNVDAHTDRDANNVADLPRPQGSPARTFDFTLDLTQAPSSYTNAAVTELFYWCNWMHDRLYALGFTEAARNFQSNNFARGGLGNDALQADAQDGSGSNNANMSTPADGSAPRMQMYVFTGPAPDRDGALDQEIVLHEYTHGLSNRRVGGGVGLSTLQSRGLGEGWSDWYGLALLSEPGDDIDGTYAAGAYATYQLSGLLMNYYYGIRRYPYSTDMLKNPLTFKDIDPAQASLHPTIPRSPIIDTTADEVHNAGEVWCAALWEARANMITKHGFSVGNELILRLVTDGMNLSPANPNYLQARDAILQADAVNNGGANLTELWAAFAKRGMGFSASSPPSSTTVGLVEAYDVPDDLSIIPTGLAASGAVGGPFNPGAMAFMLTNTGTANLNWALVNTSAWFNVSPTSGALMPGGPANAVTVTVLPAANTLPAGGHVATIRFTNTSSRVVQSRTVTLNAVGSGVADDFDPDFDPSQWSAFGGILGSTILATNFGSYVSSPNSLWFGDGGMRHATTIPINTSGGGSIAFALRISNGSSWPWEMADLPNEGVVFESSTNSGAFWNLLNTFNSTPYQVWTTITSTIPVAARSPATLFRWRQLTHSGASFDHWALDNVLIDATPATILTLTIPNSASEGDAPIIGTVAASPTPTNDLIVALSSLDTTEVTVPATVTIPGGQSSNTFNLTIVDDIELDGTQTAQLTASASGYSGAVAALSNFDNETATLSLAIPATAMEGHAPVQGTVGASTAPTSSISVDLSSSDTSEILVPASVFIPAGHTSAVFSVSIVDDLQIDGAQAVTVSARVTNWTGALTSTVVEDNEPTNLVVTLPASAREGIGSLAGAGSVRISGTLPTNLVVGLLSSDTTELSVPPTAIILAGQELATFNLTIVNDPDIDSSQPVSVSASADGFSIGSASMTVTDDESPLEPFNPSPAHLATNVIQSSDLAWSSGALPGEVITNDIYFGITPTPGAAELLGTTTSTTWPLPTLPPQTTYYWQIVARKAGTTPGPVWQFTTRGVDHFVWDAIPSTQYVSRPFGVTVTAKDAFEATVSNFTGRVGLSAQTGPGTPAQLVTFDDLPGTGVQIPAGYRGLTWSNFNYIDGTISYPNSGYTAGRVSAPNAAYNSYAGSVSVSSTEQFNLMSAYLTAAWNDNLRVEATGYNGTTLVYSNSYTLSATIPTLINFNYLGVTRVAFVSSGGTLHPGFSSAEADGPAYTGGGTHFVMDSVVVGGAALPVPITPTNSDSFVDGVWIGNVTALAPTTNLVLNADDGAGHVGSSSPVVVGLENDIGVSVTDAPDPLSLGGNITYTITVTNVGPNAARDVLVSNRLHASTSLVSVTPSQGNATNSGNVVLASLGSMPGDSSATITIVAATRAVGTLTNHVFITRSDADAFGGNDSAVTTTVVQSPVITLSDATMYEGNPGGTNVLIHVSITPPPVLPASVGFYTSDGTAMAPGDYSATNGVLTFAPGETNKPISIRVSNDVLYEANEYFHVHLLAISNALITDSSALATLLNDDPMPTLSVGDVTLTEGHSGATNALFPVTLSTASGLTTTFSYSTVNGSAGSGTDFIAKNGSMSLAQGVTSTNILVMVNGDTATEPDEVFYMDLSSVANAILLKREGYGLILNDDGLAGDLDHFTWSAISSPQYVGQPFGVTLHARDAFDNPAVNFKGTASLGVIGGPGSTNILGTNTTTVSFPIYTAANAERTQVIYPAAEIGGAGRIGALAIEVASLPVLGLSNWTIRLKPTVMTNYTSYQWESTNWTIVCQTNLSLLTTGWVTFPFNAPFDYDGTNSLMVDFSFYNSTSYGAGSCRATARPTVRTMYYYTSSYGNPLTWAGTSTPYNTTTYTPNLQLIRTGSPILLQPAATEPFTNGTWTGNLAVPGPATNLVLRAADLHGHAGSSSPFNVYLHDDLSVTVNESPDPVALGALLTYSITISNTGPAAATDVIVTNLLPAGVNLDSVELSQGITTNLGQTVIAHLGTLASTSTATITLFATPTNAGVITNIAMVARAGTELHTANNCTTNTTRVAMPALTINDASATESPGPNSILFDVRLDLPNPQTTTVSFATTDGTAFEGADYQGTNGVLTFLPGETNQSVSIPLFDDVLLEFNETFSVNLSGAVSAVISKATGTGTIIDNEGPPAFQIVALLTNNSRVVDHALLTGDDRGGIALSSSQVFVTGDSATARFTAADLTAGVGLGRIADSLCTDLRTETVYALGNGTNPLGYGGGVVSTLIELSGATGQPTGVLVPLSQPFTASGSCGIFSGYERVVVFTANTVYDIHVASGNVNIRGTMTRPAWYTSESWAIWGVAEFFNGQLYLTYRESGTQRIVRSRVPDGLVSPVATFSNLSDMASFVVSPSRNRWYFHHESGGQFGGSSETLGYADAQFMFAISSPPLLQSQPGSQAVELGGAATFTVTASGSSPLYYQWAHGGAAIPGATNSVHTISPVHYGDAGSYSVLVSNNFGIATSTNAILTVGTDTTDYSIHAFDKGWYNASGYHDPGNSNYFCGDSSIGTGTPLRNWFTFNIPALPTPVVTARLRVNTYGVSSPTGSETYQLRHVSTPVPTLVAGGSGQLATYNDLADGAIYGNRSISTGDANSFVTIALNSDFVAHITAAYGQQFAMGGEITTLDATPSNSEILFSSSAGLITDVELILSLSSPPAQLQFLDPEWVSDTLRLRLSTVDGSPITAGRASNIWIYASTNLSLPMSSWNALTNATRVTNGLLVLDGIVPTHSTALYFRAVDGAWTVLPLEMHGRQTTTGNVSFDSSNRPGPPLSPMREQRPR